MLKPPRSWQPSIEGGGDRAPAGSLPFPSARPKQNARQEAAIATTLTLLIISIICLNYRSVRWIGIGYLTVVALIFPVQFLLVFCSIVIVIGVYLMARHSDQASHKDQRRLQ